MRNVANEEHQGYERGDNQKANAAQPWQPVTRTVREFHAFPAGDALAAKNRITHCPARRR
jgi:hypothetical protein